VKIVRIFFLFLIGFLFPVIGFAQSELPAYGHADIEDFLDRPETIRPVLSPNGRYIAFMVHTDHSENGDVLIIRDLDAPDETNASQTGFGRLPITNITWASDDRVLVTVLRRGLVRVRGVPIDVPTLRTVSYDRRDMSQPTILFESERRVFSNLYNAFGNELVNTLPNEPEHILMAAYRGDSLDLWRVNILTGEADVVEDANERTRYWHTNAEGYAVMRVDVNSRARRVEIFTRQPGERRWRRTAQFRTSELSDRESDFAWGGASDQPGQIYVFSRPDGSDRRGIYLYDLAEDTYLQTMAEHDRVDISHVVIDPQSGAYLGYAYTDDRFEVEITDSDLRRHFRGLLNFFGEDVSVLPVSFAGDRMVLFVTGPREAGVYYLYDRASGSVDPLMTLRPRLPADVLHDVEIVRYQASDGVPLTAYLTQPRSGMGPSTPLILLPHGGPERRDDYGFDFIAQYYASRGYAVLQPNFRGSSGYGRNFAESGYGRWGERMQQDLDDAVQVMIDQGRVAPDRICIAGFSYGGYAALMGGATRPDLYQCVFAGAAVTDLLGFVDYWRRHNEFAHEYWVTAIGNPRTDRERMYLTSPLHLADRMTMPVLLAHGTDDSVVPFDHTERMAMALAQVGGDYFFQTYSDAGHSFEEDGNWRLLLTQTTAMFDRVIGPERGQYDSIFLEDWPTSVEAATDVGVVIAE